MIKSLKQVVFIYAAILTVSVFAILFRLVSPPDWVLDRLTTLLLFVLFILSPYGDKVNKTIIQLIYFCRTNIV